MTMRTFVLALLISALPIVQASAQAYNEAPQAEYLADEDDPIPRQAPPNHAPAPTIQVVKVSGKQKLDPFRLKMVMQFPRNVKSVQQAAQYMLETIDYQLVISPAAPKQTREILLRALLPQDADGSLKTIEDGLLLVSGDDTILVIDREHKMITFEFADPKKP